MKHFVAILMLLLASQYAAAIELKDGVVVLTEQEKVALTMCATQHGCHVITVDKMVEIAEGVAKQQLIQARKAWEEVCAKSI